MLEERLGPSHSPDLKFCINTSAAAAAAKSLQSCPTLCNPIDGSPQGSPLPGILQARILEWVAISFLKCWCKISLWERNKGAVIWPGTLFNLCEECSNREVILLDSETWILELILLPAVLALDESLSCCVAQIYSSKNGLGDAWSIWIGF